MNYHSNSPATHAYIWSDEYKLSPPPAGVVIRTVSEPPPWGPQPPADVVVEAQDTAHTREDFMRDLEKVTQRKEKA